MKFTVTKFSEKRLTFGAVLMLLLKSIILKFNEFTLSTLKLAKSFKIPEMNSAWRGILRLSRGKLQIICREFSRVHSIFMLADINKELKQFPENKDYATLDITTFFSANSFRAKKLKPLTLRILLFKNRNFYRNILLVLKLRFQA